jgi:hypothetical protein
MGNRSKRYHAYRYRVRHLTDQHRGPMPYGYTVDHIVPVSFGFNHDIPAELIGSRENLHVVPFQDNLAKGAALTDASCALLHRWGFGHVADLTLTRRAA